MPLALMVDWLGSLPLHRDAFIVTPAPWRAFERFCCSHHFVVALDLFIALRDISLDSSASFAVIGAAQAALARASYFAPRIRTAQMMRANLLASATSTSLNFVKPDLHVSSGSAQWHRASLCPMRRKRAEQAPETSNLRN